MKRSLVILIIFGVLLANAGAAPAANAPKHRNRQGFHRQGYCTSSAIAETAAAVLAIVQAIRDDDNGCEVVYCLQPPAPLPVCANQAVCYPAYYPTPQFYPAVWGQAPAVPRQYYPVPGYYPGY